MTVSATVLVTILAAMLAYYIVRHKNWISNITFALMVASMIIPFQAIMIPLVSIYGGNSERAEPQGDSDLYAHGIFHGHVRVYVPRLYQRKCSHGFGGGDLY